MVMSLLRRIFPKFAWEMEKKKLQYADFPSPTLEFVKTPPFGAEVSIVYVIDGDGPVQIENVWIDGRKLEKDEYSVK